MKPVILVLLIFAFSGCISHETTYNHKGEVIDDKYIIKRPVKEFIEKVEFE